MQLLMRHRASLYYLSSKSSLDLFELSEERGSTVRLSILELFSWRKKMRISVTLKLISLLRTDTITHISVQHIDVHMNMMFSKEKQMAHTLASLLLRPCLSSPFLCLELELLLPLSLLLALLGSEVDDWLAVRLRPWCSDLGVRCSTIEGEGTGSLSLSKLRFDNLESVPYLSSEKPKHDQVKSIQKNLISISLSQRIHFNVIKKLPYK